MRIIYRRLACAALEHPINDPLDRNVMAMSTLIASEQWLHEVPWDGMGIGDVSVFRNKAFAHNGTRMTKPGDEVDARGRRIEVPLEDEWVWWSGVPRAKIKSYRFLDEDCPLPQTIPDPELPFELPNRNAQRKEKSDQAGEGGPATA